MHWNEMVRVGCSVEAYERVVKKLFKDHQYTSNRYNVLNKYTMDICQMEPSIADEIRKSHESFLKKHPLSKKVILESFLTYIDLMLSRGC